MASPQRYRKRPLEIEAMRFTGSNEDEILDWVTSLPNYPPIWVQKTMDGKSEIVVKTTTGDATIHPGWWVCKGIEDEVYPCKPSIFDATYEAAEVWRT